MGIDICGLETILKSLSFSKNKNKCLTLGRQGIHINKYIIDLISKKYNINFTNNIINPYCEKLFNELGFETVESIDKSTYENATYIHDLNISIPSILKNRFDYIFDGGCIEHIFNTSQVCQNIIDMLNINGLFVSVTCNNNFSGHGIYQFSPEFFMSVFSKKYGMEILELYLAKVNDLSENWINVKTLEGINGRNVTKINTLEETYIIAIAKKINNTNLSLLSNPPQQYSYENYDWKKN